MLKKKAHSQQWRCIQLENPDFRLNSLCSNPGFISTSLVTWGQLPNCWYLISSPVCCYSVTQSCPALFDPLDCNMPGFPVLHHLPELAQTHVHRVGDAIVEALIHLKWHFSSNLSLQLFQYRVFNFYNHLPRRIQPQTRQSSCRLWASCLVFTKAAGLKTIQSQGDLLELCKCAVLGMGK